MEVVMAAKKTSESSLLEKARREAAALPQAEVISMANIEPNLARANVTEGRKNVLAEREALDKVMKKAAWERVERIEIVVSTLVPAKSAAPPPKGADPDLGVQVARMWELRGRLLPLIELLASSGILSEAKVAKIRKGRGSLDGANDLVDIAKLLGENEAAVRGKLGPITPAEVLEAASLGAALGLRLRPTSAKKTSKVTQEQREAEDARNRLFTILQRDYDYTWRLGAVVFGRDVDAKVPPMMSRRRTGK
jgi:hypothetical protein